MTPFAVAIVWCILQVTLLCVLGGLLYLLVRKAEPRLAVSSIAVLLGLVTVLSLAALSPWPRWRIGATHPPVEARSTAAAANPGTSQAAVGASHENTAVRSAEQPTFLTGAFWTAVWEELNRPIPPGQDASPAEAAEFFRPWSTYVLFFLSIAAGIGGIRLAAACYALRRLRLGSVRLREARIQGLLRSLEHRFVLHRPLEIREASQLTSAATIGWRRPIILLPAQWRTWPEDELRAVLAHEMAHIAARDWPTWLLAQCAVALHFYHPLVHWLAHRLRLEQELAADAAAAAATGSKDSYLGNLAAQMLRADQTRPLWATQTFLPTRSTIVRRIEMLKSTSPNLLAERTPRSVRAAFAATLFGLALAVAGLRVPAQTGDGAALGQSPRERPAPQTTAFGAENADTPMPLSLIPGDAVMAVSLRPAQALSAPEMADVAERLNAIFTEMRGPLPLQVEDIDTWIIAPYESRNPRIVLRGVKPIDAGELALHWVPDAEEKTADGRALHVSTDPAYGGVAALQLDERTIVFDTEAELRELAAEFRAAQQGKDTTQVPDWLTDAPQPSTPIWAAVNSDTVRKLSRNQHRDVFGGLPYETVAPLVEDTRAVFIAADVSPNLSLKGRIDCDSAEAAQNVAATVKALLTFAQNAIQAQLQQASQVPEGTPAAVMNRVLPSILEVVKVAEVRTEQATVFVTSQSSVTAQQVFNNLILPAFVAPQAAAKRAQSRNNLRQIAVAMHRYHDQHGHFPPPVITGPGGAKHSWRVALLPYLEQDALFNEYRLTEPWDSRHNRTLLEKMPAVYRSPTDRPNWVRSGYFVLVGEKTMFPPAGEGLKISDLKDGTSSTLMLVEAERDTPWTKPEDIPYSSDLPLPQLGGFFDGIFLAAFADAHIEEIEQDIDPAVLRRLIEKADGQPVQR